MMIALIANKNNPKVTTVIGKVKNTKTGLTMAFKIAKTTATIIDDVMFSTETPPINFEMIITKTAVINSLIIVFIKLIFLCKCIIFLNIAM